MTFIHRGEFKDAINHIAKNWPDHIVIKAKRVEGRWAIKLIKPATFVA